MDELNVDRGNGPRLSSDSDKSDTNESGFVSRESSVSDSKADLKKKTDNMDISEPPAEGETEKAAKKRKWKDEANESKRMAEEEYNQQIHEQRYKRLMHLLNKSQFYASYLVDKISSSVDTSGKSAKVHKRGRQHKAAKENTSPSERPRRKRTPKEYDIREYISDDMKKQLTTKRPNMNLSEEDIEEQLNSSEDEDEEMTETECEIPKYFNGDLRDYQKKGLQWLKVLYENGMNGILADEMGLGKTVQIIALLSHLIEKRQDGPYLIIAPLSTVPNWILEFERFAPHIPLVVFHGSGAERQAMYKKIKQKTLAVDGFRTQPVVITTFEVPLFEAQFLKTQKWRYIIIDEGHRIKNHECQLVKVLKSCQSMNRLLLTGTPLQNNLAELWSLLNFLLPEIFNDLAVFESWFDVKELQDDEGTKKLLKQEEEKHVLSSLREILKPFLLRREKSDVCLDIPQKKEVIVYAPLTQLQLDLYKAVLNRDIHTMSKIEEQPVILDEGRPKRKCFLRSKYGTPRKTNDFEREDSPFSGSNGSDRQSVDRDDEPWKKEITPADEKSLSLWKQYTDINERNRDFLIRIQFKNRLAMYKKIVNHPYLVHCPLDPTGLPLVNEDLVKSSGKLLVLDAMLKKLHSANHKVLLFSTMTMVLDMLEDYLSMRTYKYVRLDGSTKIENRKENIKIFNSDPTVFLFLMTTRAGGVGLNLASADTVILYDSDWNPQADIQAMARCHRIGQTRPVVIYRFCTSGTIDESIINRADAKRILEKMVISKKLPPFNLHSKGTLAALKELLESKESEVVRSENEVFTEAELKKLLDRSDMLPQKTPTLTKKAAGESKPSVLKEQNKK